MGKIALVNSPIILNGEDGDERSYYPLNLLYLAAALEAESHEVRVLDVAAMGMNDFDITNQIHFFEPDIIGITAMTPSIRSAVTIAKKIKFSYPDIPIGLGGVHITVDRSFCDRNQRLFDFWVFGEGEYTFPKIVEKYMKTGKLMQKEWYGHACEDLDALPFPARHLIDPSIYKRKEQMKYEVPAAGILSSRGCPFNCIFCSIPNRGKRVRYRSAKNVVEEMESIYETCRGRYSFVDDNFTVNRKRTHALCQEIIDKKIQCHWIASTHPAFIDEETIKILKRAGCDELYFGVESGNIHIRNAVIGKHCEMEDIKKAVELCTKHKIMSNLFLMVGFPGETKKHLRDTIDIGNIVKADAIGVHITIPYPGSKLFSMAGLTTQVIDDYANGVRSNVLDGGFRTEYPLFVPKGLSLADLVKAKKQAYRRFYLHPLTILRRIRVWFRMPGRFKEDLKLFRIAFGILWRGGSRGQLS